MTHRSKKNRDEYHAIALAAYGPLPVACRCGELVASLEMYVGVVHHKNEDYLDNRPENLEIMHHGCHLRHHKTGMVVSSETRTRMSAALTGRKQSPEEIERRRQSLLGHEVSSETRQKISDANSGRKMTQEQKEQLSEQLKGKLVGAAVMRSKCLTCGKIGARGPMGMHAKHKNHEVVPA